MGSKKRKDGTTKKTGQNTYARKPPPPPDCEEHRWQEIRSGSGAVRRLVRQCRDCGHFETVEAT